MMAVGSENGTVSFYDTRTAGDGNKVVTNPFTTLNVGKDTEGLGFADDKGVRNLREVSSLAFSTSGVYMAFGTTSGCVALYDIRSSKPLHVKEHQYGLPIHTVRFHEPSRTVMSGDEKIIKCWRYGNESSFNMKNNIFGGFGGIDDEDDNFGVGGGRGGGRDDKGMGSIVCNIEGSAPFRHFEVSHDEIMDGSDPLRSGLILAAGDQSRVQAYYAPVLGPAPRWCSFLDSITEELEERGMADEGVKERNTESVYDDYKFLTKEEVEMLGINNLVGTPLLKGYMHGYFIETR